VSLLGAGGMGAVYEAVHQFTRRSVAVKLMHASISRSGLAAERFLREAQAPSSIGHPGIVEVLDGGYDQDGSLYLARSRSSSHRARRPPRRIRRLHPSQLRAAKGSARTSSGTCCSGTKVSCNAVTKTRWSRS
jgi:serine/threonine protein kinase